MKKYKVELWRSDRTWSYVTVNLEAENEGEATEKAWELSDGMEWIVDESEMMDGGEESVEEVV